MKTKHIVGVAAVLVVLLLIYVKYSTRSTPKIINPENLPGIQRSDVPWQPELGHLRERLGAIGLPALQQEGAILHIHQHLDIFIHGQAIQVPQGIGINEAAQFISPVHTHDASGIIHVESPIIQTFTLGEFFDVWGVRFSSDCLGSYCADKDNLLKVFINGSPITGNPRLVALDSHQEIVVAYGTLEELPKPLPMIYLFEPGL